MNFKLKTSAKTMNTLKELQSSTGLTPNVIARLATSLSLLQPDLPDEKDRDPNGMEFNRHTLTGQQDLAYRCLIAQRHGRQVKDEEYFPTLLKRHIDRGTQLLADEYKYAGNFERLVRNLISKGVNR